jgi:hypothetical protein
MGEWLELIKKALILLLFSIYLGILLAFPQIVFWKSIEVKDDYLLTLNRS